MKQPSIASKTLNTKLARIEQRSQKDPNTTFNNLVGPALDLDLLRAYFYSLNVKKTVGVDGITKEQYGRNLEINLQDLFKKIRNGSYYPQPFRIVEIPKADGSMRHRGQSPVQKTRSSKKRSATSWMQSTSHTS